MDAWDLTEEVSFRQKKTPQSREWHKMGKGKEPRKNMAPKDVLLWFRPLGLWIINSMAKELGLGFPGGASSKELTCQCRRLKDLCSIPGLGRSPGGGNGNPLQLFLPGESHGQRSLAGYSPRGHKELDLTDVT